MGESINRFIRVIVLESVLSTLSLKHVINLRMRDSVVLIYNGISKTGTLCFNPNIKNPNSLPSLS